MKALVYHGPGQKDWETKTDPKILAPSDAIVRIDSSTICGTEGRLAGMMLGSVTQRLLRIAPCPVLAVPTRTAVAAGAN